jgi:hypothetical protein
MFQMSDTDQDKDLGCGLGLGIFLLPFVFAWFTLTDGYSTRSRLFAFGWMAIVLASAFTGNPPWPTDQQGAVEQQAQVDTENEEPSRNWVNVSCKKMVERFGASSDLTDLQKEERWPKYEGRPFKWDLEIVDVSEETLGGYQVQAKCRGSTSFVQDVAISYDSDAKRYVLDLEKGAIYELTGELTTYSGFVGIMADGFIE